MKALHGVLLAGLSFVLAGCELFGGKPHILKAPTPVPGGGNWTHECVLSPSEVCEIEVTVSGNKCDAVQAQVKVTADRYIHWKLSDKSWKFAANGIDFLTPKKPPNPPPNRDAANAFDKLQGANTPQYQAHLKGTAAAGQYPYTIRLIDPSGNPCEVDPGIWV